MIITLGIDVSKEKLDLCASQTKFETINNNARAIKTYFKKNLQDAEKVRIVMESTGKYHRLAHKLFYNLGCEVMIINPYQSRNFARSMNIACKTDKVDSKVLCLFGETHQFKVTKPMDETQEEMCELAGRREQLIQELIKEKTRLHGAHKRVVGSIKGHIRFLEQEIDKVDESFTHMMKSDSDLSNKMGILQSVPGVGVILSTSIIAHLSEIGTLSRGATGALAGLAPMNRDSGTMRGKRCIQKGRSSLRNSLYMPILNAIRNNEVIAKLYKRLSAAGKPSKVALTACMRKLLCILNAMIRENRKWQDRSIVSVASAQSVIAL